MSYSKSNTVSFKRENIANSNFSIRMVMRQNSPGGNNSFSKPVTETDLLSSPEDVIGELDMEFEKITYDGS